MKAAILAGIAVSLLSASAAAEDVPSTIPQYEALVDATGTIGVWQSAGAVAASGNPFFMPLGTNGRTCATCHVRGSGMSVTARSLQARYTKSNGRDPVFAAVDGSNCPANPQAQQQSHSLLLNKGLFRIALPIPVDAQYTLKVLSDPYGCETNPTYDSRTIDGVLRQVVSVYRRPIIAANLPFANAVPSGTSAGTLSGNIMADGREPTLESQAIDAVLNHAQATTPPSTADIAKIVAYESGIFTAQATDNRAGSLTGNGAQGGAQILANEPAGIIDTTGSLTPYAAWKSIKSGPTAQSVKQASIYRGQQIFSGATVTFAIDNVAGLNNVLGSNPVTGASCGTCHNQQFAGSSTQIASQADIGIGGDSPNFGGPAPSSDLPVFQLTCPAGTTLFNGHIAKGITTVRTNDPGVALISGKCADIGRLTVPALRGLAARAPYFTDGSAPTLDAVVAFYNRRFHIGLTRPQQQDLVNFLSAL